MTNHVPNIWGDIFSNFTIDDKEQEKNAAAIEALKQEARCMLMEETTPLNQMILIDTLERLGLAYLFEIEIEHILQQINNAQVLQHCDLFATSLGFRLLRQHRHHISCNVFNKFVNGDGMFEEENDDVEGVLSLYEAAYVRFHDEEILQRAEVFSNSYLRRIEAELESPLREKVKRALEHPLHRSNTMVYARIFISIYEKGDSKNQLLLKLAKFNFNFLQNLYRKELYILSRWWKKFDLKSKLAYARDRVVEAHLWCVAFHHEPQYSRLRIGFAKGLQVITIMDDTYDNYATLKEAQLFTEVLCRWNIDEAERLPEYMRIVYLFIMSVYEDYELEAKQLGKGFAAPYFKQTVQQLGKAYNEELKWLMERKVPSFQDYLRNSEITSCIYIMFAATIPGLKSVTQQTIDWINTQPKLVTSTAMLGRYWDDLGSHHRESKGGQVVTRLECNMKQHGVTTKEEAASKFVELNEEAWRDINRELVETTSSVANEIAVEFLNYARGCDATYNINNGDAYTDPKLAMSNVVALFLQPLLF
ncbi:cis-muuroladiene synthase-like [Salvia hispanica]|uniref:cis-muuroladiene synthase-like n=1 Tax=Salvia hispanica TaxID=49212 RepID=UPI00200939C9|nr:cis-muuroladiene synthase-like [Salvia hispanica]